MTQSLSARLKQPGLISAPGVFEMISARIADTMGFDALYMTGYGVVASHLGLPDAGLASYTEMVGRVHQIASGTSTPLIADGDTGYGGLLNVDFTVRGYEKAGAQAIQIEDQEYPKKCGHTPGRRVVPIADAARRIKVAVEARASKDFLVIARTDARTALGLDEALRRGEAFLKAGADMLFIESPESEAELAKIGKTFAGVPLVANMVEGGRTPILARGAARRTRLRHRDLSGRGLPDRHGGDRVDVRAYPANRQLAGVVDRALQFCRDEPADGLWRGLAIRSRACGRLRRPARFQRMAVTS